MGKTSTPSAAPAPKSPTEMKRKKKKGRPSLTDLQLRQIHPQLTNNKNNNNKTNTIKTHPISTPPSSSSSDDERTKKKLKLIVRLPKNAPSGSAPDSGSDSGSDIDLGGDTNQPIRSVDQEEKVSKAIDVIDESQLETGPTTPLPEKKLLVFILDRLQKKDTYGVFSEPVDPNELPDYLEIIEQPMDFGTLRKKLNGKAYNNLEELEADILLICSNAMQYNAPDTVYYRQARSIEEIARRDFANLRHEGDDGELQPKIVRRGRPPGKTQKKHIEKSPVDRIGPEMSPDVALASVEEKGAGPSSAYSLRKTSTSYRYQSSDGFFTPNRSSIGENASDWSIDWSNEFPASILRADLKHGNKNVTVDLTKRDSYREHPPVSDDDFSGILNIDGDKKRLMPVGLNFGQHVYARSLAKFAASLGPAAWKVASRRLESVLPAGVKFGPGWVGETESLPSFSGEKQKSPSHSAPDLHSSSPVAAPSTPGEMPALHQSRPSEQMVEAVRQLNSQNELPLQSGASAWGVQGWPLHALQKSMFHPSRNGFSGLYGQSLSQLGMSGPQEGLTPPYQRPGIVQRNDASSSSVYPEESKFSPSSNMLGKRKAPDSSSEPGGSHPGRLVHDLAAEQKPCLPIPPDLNVRVAGPSSPSSSLVADSPQQQQPDLALQL